MITLNEVDCGVEYNVDGNTVSFVGEQDSGEVHVNDEFYGYYELDDDVITITDRNGNELTSFPFDDDSYETFVASIFE